MSEERVTQDGVRRGPIDRLRASLAAGSPGRRRLLTAAAVAAALGVLVVAPGYFAFQPGFMQRYSNLEPKYATWATSVHVKVPCRKCHVEPGVVAQTGFAARMLGEAYVSLVTPGRQFKGLAKPTSAACSDCHIDLRTVSPSGDLNIPHRAHVTILGMECVKCHAYLVHEKSPEGRNTPRMVTCLECHDGKQAKNACTTCHTEKAAPADHRSPDWIVVHPDMQKKVDCAKCHAWTDEWCVECHTRRPRSHVARWRTTHRLQVEKHRNCEACHAADFCVKCHGEVPTLNFDPTLERVE